MTITSSIAIISYEALLANKLHNTHKTLLIVTYNNLLPHVHTTHT
jgi:hypothetical protein